MYIVVYISLKTVQLFTAHRWAISIIRPVAVLRADVGRWLGNLDHLDQDYDSMFQFQCFIQYRVLLYFFPIQGGDDEGVGLGGVFGGYTCVDVDDTQYYYPNKLQVVLTLQW